MFDFIEYPCASINCSYQMLYFRYSQLSITSDSFEILELIFCLLVLYVNTHIPKVITTPVCPLISMCTKWYKPTQVCIYCKLFSLMIISSSIVWLMKHSKLLNFFQYSSSGCFILVHRNIIAVAQSGRPLWKIHISFMKTEWKVWIIFPCSYLKCQASFPVVS